MTTTTTTATATATLMTTAALTTTTTAAATQKLNPVPDFETFYHFELKGVSKNAEEGHSPQKFFFWLKKKNFSLEKKLKRCRRTF